MCIFAASVFLSYLLCPHLWLMTCAPLSFFSEFCILAQIMPCFLCHVLWKRIQHKLHVFCLLHLSPTLPATQLTHSSIENKTSQHQNHFGIGVVDMYISHDISLIYNPCFFSLCVTYSIYEIFPLSIFDGEIDFGDGYLEELPLSLRPHHLTGKLCGPR